MDKPSLLWGIDLGGTKIELAVLKDNSDYDVLWRNRVMTEGHLGYEKILENIGTIIHQAASDLGIYPGKIGMGTPGIENPENGLMKNCNTVVLNGKPLHRDLEEIFSIDFSLANDANCFALAEAQIGAVKTSQSQANLVFGVIMGTGVGGAIVHNGALISGKHGIAGEWGHHYLMETEEQCYCGRNGCTEQFISGPALERYYQAISGEKLSLKEVVQRYRNGSDKYAVETMNRLFNLFARGISNVINILDPDVIVLGGGLGNIDELYVHGVSLIKEHIFNDRMDTIFLKPKLGDSAGVFGAALLNK
jgi:predicted NBD/HSP70 family sugar kinase